MDSEKNKSPMTSQRVTCTGQACICSICCLGLDKMHSPSPGTLHDKKRRTQRMNEGGREGRNGRVAGRCHQEIM